MKEVVFAGFGGQGVLTAGLILAQIALYNKQKATWIPEYGAAMRGGTSNCTVKYDPEEVGSPGQEIPDLVMALNNPSFSRFVKIVKPGGTILVNSDLVTVDLNVRDDITVVAIPGTSLADEIGSQKTLNVIMVGALVKSMGDFTPEDAIAGMNDMFAKKGKNQYEDLNVKAFKAGYDAV